MKAIILITLLAFAASFKKPYVKKFDTNLNLTPYDFSSSLITNTLSARFVQTSTKNVLTGEGIMHSWILGNSIWLGFGYQGWTYMVSYFVLGSLVTKLKFDLITHVVDWDEFKLIINTQTKAIINVMSLNFLKSLIKIIINNVDKFK